jgi:hypothetical protein
VGGCPHAALPETEVIRQLYTDAAALGIYLATVGRLAVEEAMAAARAEETRAEARVAVRGAATQAPPSIFHWSANGSPYEIY